MQMEQLKTWELSYDGLTGLIGEVPCSLYSILLQNG